MNKGSHDITRRFPQPKIALYGLLLIFVKCFINVSQTDISANVLEI